MMVMKTEKKNRIEHGLDLAWVSEVLMNVEKDFLRQMMILVWCILCLRDPWDAHKAF